MRGFISFLIDSIVPVTCVACGREIAPEDAAPETAVGVPQGPAFDPGGLFFDLAAGIRISARILCRDCWATLERAFDGGALAGSGVGEPVIAPFYTNDTLLAVVRFLKFSAGRSAVPPLAWWMARALERHLGAGGGSAPARALLVPVPLHPRRLRERGYNQARLLAEYVGRELGLPVEPDPLVRERNTKSQSKLRSEERAPNVSGAFTLAHPDLIAGRHVILVDDLVTTGETARACLATLAAAAPASVAVLAAGRVRDSRLTGPK